MVHASALQAKQHRRERDYYRQQTEQNSKMIEHLEQQQQQQEQQNILLQHQLDQEGHNRSARRVSGSGDASAAQGYESTVKALGRSICASGSSSSAGGKLVSGSSAAVNDPFEAPGIELLCIITYRTFFNP